MSTTFASPEFGTTLFPPTATGEPPSGAAVLPGAAGTAADEYRTTKIAFRMMRLVKTVSTKHKVFILQANRYID